MTEGTTLISCQWCEKRFQARRGGGSPQRFCGPKCRTLFWSGLRRLGEKAITAGVLTIADVKNGVMAACTPPRGGEPLLPLFDIAQGYTECPATLLRFLVEVERGTVASLVKLRFISRDQGGDLVAIIDALKRLGQAPNISRLV